MGEEKLSHLGEDGAARMVDVSGKEITLRTARAEAVVRVGREVGRLLAEKGGVKKGNVLETARIAAILAAKRTPDLIPLCHPLAIDEVEVVAELEDERVRLTATVTCHGRTGVEMEAMTAAAVGALTVYDMCKSAAKGILVERVGLLEKSGGRSGRWVRPAGDDS